MTTTKKFLVIILLFCLSLCIIGCDTKESHHVQPQVIRPVKTLTISTSKILTEREFPGVVDAVKKADLSFQVAGKLQEIIVKEGASVKKGDIIAQLDKTQFQLRYNGYKTDYNHAKADFDRGSKLVEQGYLSRSDFDKLKAKKDIAQLQLESAQQNLNYTELKAPFSGHIAKHHVENFEEIQAKQEIVTLQKISSLLVEIDVSESVLIKVKGWGENRVQYAQFDNIKGIKFPLTFKEVSTLADEESQTFKVVFAMPAPDKHTVLPGMTVRVFIGASAVSLKNHKIYLPAHAVLEDNTGRYVYIANIDQQTSHVTIHRNTVSTGELKQQGLEMLSGLKEGDLVVVAGMSKLSEGLQVRLMDEISK